MFTHDCWCLINGVHGQSMITGYLTMIVDGLINDY